MRERDRLSIRAHREEIESIEQAERERVEAPIRAAEERLKESHRRLAQVYRDRLLGKVKDPDRIPVDPSVTGIRMPRAEADNFNRREFAKFKNEHLDVYWTHELLVNLGDYFHKNGLQIVTAGMIGSLIERYREYALLPDPPLPEPEPEPIAEPAKPIEPELEHGWDDSGNPLTLTRRQVDRLSSTEYRKFKRLDRAALEDSLPRFGPGSRRLT